MEKLLTIIVPTYNKDLLLDRCLTSLIIEDEILFNLLEVIVVNDGSTDRSSEIAHKYESQSPEVFHVVDKVNGNYGSSVNCALKFATGKYVKLLDADDYYLTDEFEKMLNRLQEVDTDLVLTDYTLVSNRNTSKLQTRIYSDNRIFDFNKQKDVEEIGSWIMHNITIKTEIFRCLKYHQTEGISYTDNEWVFFPLFKARNCLYMKLNVYQYCIGGYGQTVSLYELSRNIGSVVSIGERMIDSYNKYNKNELLPGQISLLKNQIESLFSHIVIIVLFRLPVSRKRMLEIKRFNDKLKTIPDIYQKTDKIQRGGYEYVHFWRLYDKDMRTSIKFGLREFIACCMGRRSYKLNDLLFQKFI